MRTLQFAPISGRRSSVSRLTWWIAPSLVVHALLVVASGVSLVPRAKDDDRPAHEVIFLAPMIPKNEPTADASSEGSAPRFSPGWATLDATAKSAGEAAGSALGRSTGTTHTLAQAQRDLAEPETPETTDAGDQHVFQAVDVDREVAREADAVAPVYPEELRLKGVQGGVTVEFVVDTTGRVEPGSLHVIGTTHPLFATAVREAAVDMHFRPAIRSGHLVRQQVIQSFQFVIRPPAPVDSTPPAKKPDAPNGA